MTIHLTKSAHTVLVAMFLSGTVSACVPNGTLVVPAAGTVTTGPSSQSAQAAELGTTLLPQDYKQFAAIRMVVDYVRDASGPPEISEPIERKGPFGASSQVSIRYPVKAEAAARNNFFSRLTDSQLYHCSAITAQKGVGTFGRTDTALATARYFKTDCNSSLTYRRYSELEELAAQCPDPKKPCSIVTRIRRVDGADRSR